MRRIVLLGVAMALVVLVASPLGASNNTSLDGPDPAIWLSDPEGDIDDNDDLGDEDIEQGEPVDGSSGTATVNNNGATVKVKATGLEPGHAYTMWIIYFSDSTACVDGCNGADFGIPETSAGIFYGDGKVAGGSGKATFTGRLMDGYLAGPPSPAGPPFSFGPYLAGADNEFHVVIRSHGPKIPGLVSAQIHEVEGGCDREVGPDPEEMGDFPVPAIPGDCGDVQLYVFS